MLTLSLGRGFEATWPGAIGSDKQSPRLGFPEVLGSFEGHIEKTSICQYEDRWTGVTHLHTICSGRCPMPFVQIKLMHEKNITRTMLVVLQSKLGILICTYLNPNVHYESFKIGNRNKINIRIKYITTALMKILFSVGGRVDFREEFQG